MHMHMHTIVNYKIFHLTTQLILLFLLLTDVCQSASLLILMAVPPLGHIHKLLSVTSVAA